MNFIATQHPDDVDAQVRHGLRFWLAFTLIAVVFQFLCMDYVFNIYDEALTLYGALRVLHGQLPYRDFWTMYGPGQFYLFALFFKLFGVYAFWGRLFYVATNVVTASIVYRVCGLLAKGRSAAPAATLLVLIVLAGSAGTSYDFPVYQAMALVMVATLLMIERWRSGQARWVAGAGLAVGAAVLFRHDIALYGAIALLAAAAWFYLATGATEGNRLKALASDALLFAAAILVIALPVVFWMAIKIPEHDIFYSLFYVPARIYPKVRHLPFPTPMPLVRFVLNPRHLHSGGGSGLKDLAINVIVYLPLLATFVAGVVLLPSRARMTLARWQQAGYLALVLLSLLMFLKGVVRVSPLHMVQALVPALLLLCCVISRRQVADRAGRIVILAGAGLAGLMLLVPLSYCAKRGLTTVRMAAHPASSTSFRAECHPPLGLERAKCLYVAPDDARVALYLQQHTTPNQTIFDGAPRHDILVANKIALYFLSEREAATKWHDLHPGVETTEPIQDEMVHELDANHAVYVIRDSFEDGPGEPNDSVISSGVYTLDHYIDANYALETKIGTMSILRRKTPF